jgi:hypothetical protein
MSYFLDFPHFLCFYVAVCVYVGIDVSSSFILRVFLVRRLLQVQSLERIKETIKAMTTELTKDRNSIKIETSYNQ